MTWTASDSGTKTLTSTVQTVNCTVPVASPGIVTASNSASIGDTLVFGVAVGGALPTGIVAGTKYYVSTTSLSTSAFHISTTLANAIAGTNINFTGSTSGQAFVTITRRCGFTNASANIAIANTCAAGDKVVFSTSGTMPTNFVAGTTYFVIAASLSSTNIQVSATLGGSAITAGSAGTGDPTCTFEHVLATDVTNTTFDFDSDLSAMAGGDAIEMRAYSVCLASGASVLAWKGAYSNAQIIAHALCPPIASDQSVTFTAKELQGVNRAIPWKALTIGSWTLSDSGTTSALTLGSETTLATDTNNGTFVLAVDTSNMAQGDVLEARIYTIDLVSGAQTLAWKGTWQGVQAIPLKISPFVPSDQSIKCTLLQRSGTISITSMTGSIPWGTIGTGQTTGAQALITPFGPVNLAALTAVHGTTSTSLATITAMTSPAGFTVGFGWAVGGTGIQANTTATGITSATAITINQVGNASGAQTNLTFTPTNVHIDMIPVSGVITPFNSTEAVFATTSSNQFTMNGAPTGRTFPWKMLRS